MPGTPFAQIIVLALTGAIIVAVLTWLRRRGTLEPVPAAVVGVLLIAAIAYILFVRPGLGIVLPGNGPGLPADNVR